METNINEYWWDSEIALYTDCTVVCWEDDAEKLSECYVNSVMLGHAWRGKKETYMAGINLHSRAQIKPIWVPYG